MASAVLAGVVALVGVGPVALETHRSVKAPQLDSLALPALARPETQIVVPASPAPADRDRRRASRPIRRHREAVISAAPARSSRARRPRPSRRPPRLTTSAPRAPRQSGTWAVVVGVNDYPGNANDLHSAVNDANDAVHALSAMGVSSTT